MTSPRVVPLEERHVRASFACDVEALDRYFRERALHDVRTHVAACFVLTNAGEGVVAGYYTLSNASVDPGVLPPPVVKRLSRYPRLPATLLGRLAVDQRFRGLGFGEFLLLNALRRSWETARSVGSMAVLVDAKTGSREFYQRYGFIEFPNLTNRLFLPMKTIGTLLAR